MGESSPVAHTKAHPSIMALERNVVGMVKSYEAVAWRHGAQTADFIHGLPANGATYVCRNR
jgi:hypothetical protein